MHTDPSWDEYLATDVDPTGGRLDPDYDSDFDESLEEVETSGNYDVIASNEVFLFGDNNELVFQIDDDDCLRFRNRLCVPRNSELISMILNEAHCSRMSIHPGSTKMYNDLKRQFWWHGMKRDISDFVSRCLICQQVKAEHQVPSGLL
mgnify:CR=1 FL=1